MAHLLFHKIYECRSRTQIDFMIEEAQHALNADGFTKEELESIDAIYKSNDLDEIQLICAEILGYSAHAASLRDWIAKKAKRK